MCRSDNHQFGSHRPDPNRLLATNAFYLKLKLSASAPFNANYSLTLLCLPRINGCPLEVNGSRVRPDSPAYVTLHRLVHAGGVDAGASVVFGSMERIRVGEGARFEVYIGEEKLLKGVFRRGKGAGWRVDCTCVLEREVAGMAVEEAEVCVAVEGGRMRERVVVAEKKPRRRRRGGFGGLDLEEIPEEDEDEGGSWSCECECDESGSDGGEEEDLTAVEEAEMEYEMHMEGVRWAVDVGIWVVCLGVGYLISRASVKSLRRRKMLL